MHYNDVGLDVPAVEKIQLLGKGLPFRDPPARLPKSSLDALGVYLSDELEPSAGGLLKGIHRHGSLCAEARMSPLVRLDHGEFVFPRVEQSIDEAEWAPDGTQVALAALMRYNLEMYEEAVKKIRSAFSNCAGFIGLRELDCDRITAELCGLPYSNKSHIVNGNMYHVRVPARFDRRLRYSSLVPLDPDGKENKSYLVYGRLARHLTTDMMRFPSDWPWEEGFAIKPLAGTQSQMTAIFRGIGKYGSQREENDARQAVMDLVYPGVTRRGKKRVKFIIQHFIPQPNGTYKSWYFLDPQSNRYCYLCTLITDVPGFDVKYGGHSNSVFQLCLPE